MIKATTTFLTLMLIASFAGTVIGAQPMVGSAVAQGEQSSENACRDIPGATLVRGECTTPAVQGQPTCNPQTVVGVQPTIIGNKCTVSQYFYPYQQDDYSAFKDACRAISDSYTEYDDFPGFTLCYYPTTPGELTCPTGGELVGNQCVSRPGQGRG
jgi:hypothetical protein